MRSLGVADVEDIDYVGLMSLFVRDSLRPGHSWGVERTGSGARTLAPLSARNAKTPLARASRATKKPAAPAASTAPSSTSDQENSDGGAAAGAGAAVAPPRVRSKATAPRAMAVFEAPSTSVAPPSANRRRLAPKTVASTFSPVKGGAGSAAAPSTSTRRAAAAAPASAKSAPRSALTSIRAPPAAIAAPRVHMPERESVVRMAEEVPDVSHAEVPSVSPDDESFLPATPPSMDAYEPVEHASAGVVAELFEPEDSPLPVSSTAAESDCENENDGDVDDGCDADREDCGSASVDAEDDDTPAVTVAITEPALDAFFDAATDGVAVGDADGVAITVEMEDDAVTHAPIPPLSPRAPRRLSTAGPRVSLSRASGVVRLQVRLVVV